MSDQQTRRVGIYSKWGMKSHLPLIPRPHCNRRSNGWMEGNLAPPNTNSCRCGHTRAGVINPPAASVCVLLEQAASAFHLILVICCTKIFSVPTVPMTVGLTTWIEWILSRCIWELPRLSYPKLGGSGREPWTPRWITSLLLVITFRLTSRKRVPTVNP